MNNFNLEIVTPIRELDEEKVSYIRCPGLDGSFGIMANHREGVFALSVGEIKILKNGKEEYWATGGGFAEIMKDKVKLLVESIETSSEIDSARAEKSLERATQRKSEHNNLDEERIEASLMRAINRLSVSRR
ncbi:MAG: ATP synthase F1 subunit epsilon [Candidatus Marinimicrobia bacterium]|jgi:F-type H+-transporting ATPase subunit epsilon|nr:ATP synthase F1 subunit epsilon [Candidatus Neomarinimicrobiota bacterium]MBT3500869.1 ATP synthase F1 subunit epsilon [Candidatus Neomarinimicrobiota bacterium]MBT3838903.1 ATP synthase F1 subunit epsilon [Candidatus Neomarinimicrobiota bacterium]MBT4000328.1 ATP synthase F1 subunit epsilon [Candidatus Neomarinimicrobiota bacterium]MBT4282801.1 ATP synthase F1 subunit epsilon [Candidatus Neomarinimicrobiota bacterium]